MISSSALRAWLRGYGVTCSTGDRRAALPLFTDEAAGHETPPAA